LIKKSVAGGIILLFLLVSIFPMVSSISSSYNNIIYVDNDGGAYYTKIHYKIENGSLSGFVNDSFFNPIEGALVSIKCGGLHMQNISDSTGFYYIDNVPIVDCYWNVSASKKGYETFWVEMSIDINSTYDFVLTPLDTIYVDDDNTEGPWDGTLEHPYKVIQDAIDNASDGDTIFVYAGTYYEYVGVNESITLTGENRKITVIDSTVFLDGDGVTVSGFTIRGGIACVDSNNHTITGNNIQRSGATASIYLARSNNNIISDNNISKSEYGILMFFDPTYNIISGNTIFGNDNGVGLYKGADNNNISGNIISNNGLGIDIVLSDCNIISGNNISLSSNYGVCVSSWKSNTFYFNNFIKNRENAYAEDSIFIGRNNQWDSNYWDDWIGLRCNWLRFLPYHIPGKLSFNFDWHPAKEPYDIS